MSAFYLRPTAIGPVSRGLHRERKVRQGWTVEAARSGKEPYFDLSQMEGVKEHKERQGLSLHDAKLHTGPPGFFHCQWQGARVMASEPGRSKGLLSPPSSSPWGLKLGVAESAEGQAPGPGRVPKRRVRWETGVLESRDVARAPGRGMTSGLAGRALSCGPRDGRTVLLGLHAQCSDARGLAVWLAVHLVAIEARTEASCSKQAAHVCLAHVTASPRDTQEVGDAAGPRARRMSMRGHTGRHRVTGDHTGWHWRGSPIVANPGRVLNLGAVKGEMSQASWEDSGTEGALALCSCPSSQ